MISWAVALGILLVVVGALPTTGATSNGSVTYSVQTGGYNNTVRLGPSGTLSSPRVVSGPDPTNLSQEDLYVLGLNNTGFGPCSNLTVYQSTDGGASFHLQTSSGACLPGEAVDAVVLSNGALVVGAAGPLILRSTDGGAHWSTPVALGNTGSLPSLSLDLSSGELYLVWTGASGNSTGDLHFATSGDGGVTWSSPSTPLPSGFVTQQAELAVHNGSVAVAFLQVITTPLPNPNPPPGNNSTPPPPVELQTQSLLAFGSPDGGTTWGTPTVIVLQNRSLVIGAPSIAASPTGTFGIAWSQVNGSSAGNGTFVSISWDGGSTWSSPLLASATGPPALAPTTFGHTAVFDTSGRLFVTWHNYSASNPLGAQLNVAISNRSLDSFETSSFALAFRSEVGNGTQSENLAADGRGQVILAWDVYGPWNDVRFGAFVRTVSGEAVGNVTGSAGSATVELRDAATGASVGRANWNGRPFTLTGLIPDSYQVWITVDNRSTLAGTIPVVPWGATSFMVQGTGLPAPAASFPYEFVIVGAAVVVAGVSVALSYARTTRETVLRQKLRALMLEYIQDEPGASFSSVRDALGLQNGTTAYHLAVLEREGFVQSVVRGRRRHYFPVGGVVTSRDIPLSGIQASILKAVGDAPGVGLRELSRAVGREPSSVAYSVRVLVREGLLTMVRAGLRLRFYPSSSSATA